MSSNPPKSRFHIAKGSDWFDLKDVIQGPSGTGHDDLYVENSKIELLRKCNGIFINDIFVPLWNHRHGILMMDGGYGSSKTTFAITLQLVKSQENKYHRCYYGRQEKTRARELHSNIITEIKRNHWEHLFEFSEGPTASTRIVCRANGNKFELFGCDDPEGLKGIDNATDILVDEINQITFDAFGKLLTRLRTPGVHWQFIGCFNNCDVYEDHWLRKFIYVDEADREENTKEISGPERAIIEELKNVNILKHHSVYTDNYFLNHKSYYSQMVVQAGGDPEKIKGYCEGAWGISLSAKPYYKLYKESRDSMDSYPIDGEDDYNPDKPLIISIDENTNPYLPASIWQTTDGDMTAVCIAEIAGENPNNRIEWVCEQVCQMFPAHRGGIILCGDATSIYDDVKLEKGRNIFTITEENLIHYTVTRRVPKTNPNNATRQGFINLIFSKNYGGLRIIILNKCPLMKADLKNTQEDPDPKKPGYKLKKREVVNGVAGVQRWGHFCDTMDYMICEMFMNVYLAYQSKSVSFLPKSGGREVRNTMESSSRKVSTGPTIDVEEQSVSRYSRHLRSRNAMN